MDLDGILHLLREVGSTDTLPVIGTITERSFDRMTSELNGFRSPVRLAPARDGEALPYHVFGDNRDRALVLVHGAAGHGDHLRAIAGAVANGGLATVYALDMRGHGVAAVRRGAEVTHPEQLKDDIVDFLRWLHATARPQTILLGGFSAGGGLILRTAGDGIADLISGYLLLAPYLGLDAPTTRPGIGGWVTLYGRRIQALTELCALGIPTLNDVTVVDFNQPLATRDGRETLSWSFNTMLAFGPRDWRTDLAALAPHHAVLVLAGSDDECFLAGAYQAVMAATVPQAKVEVLDGVGHWDLLVEPRALAAIAAWIAER